MDLLWTHYGFIPRRVRRKYRLITKIIPVTMQKVLVIDWVVKYKTKFGFFTTSYFKRRFWPIS